MSVLYLANFISALTTSALSFVSSALALKYGGVNIAQLNVVCIYLAMAFGGILTPILSTWLKPSHSLVALEIVRFFVLVFFPFFFQTFPICIPIFTFIINSISSSFHSIKLSGIILGSSENDQNLRKAIHATSGMEGVVAIFSGLFALFSLEFIDYKFLAALDAFTYLTLTVLLYPKVKKSGLGERFNITEGFFVIFRSRPLFMMTISRILQNIPSSSISVLMPLFIPLMLDMNKYAVGLITIAISQAFSFGVFSRYLTKNYKQNIIINVSSLASFMNLLFVVLLFVFKIKFGIISLVIVGLLSGLSMSGFRMLGIFIGTKITPKESMHIVISSGDTIVRILTAIYLSIFTFFMGFHQNDVLILLLIFAAIIILKVQKILKNLNP